MLPTSDLTLLRALQEGTFDLTATITRPGAYVSDGAGGGTAAAPITVATVACRLVPNKTQVPEAVAAGLIQGQTVWRLTLPRGTDLQNQDTVAIGSRSFEVIALWGPNSYETALIALCVER